MRAEKEKSKDSGIRRVYSGGIWTKMYNGHGYGVAIQRPGSWDFRIYHDIFLLTKRGRKRLAR